MDNMQSSLQTYRGGVPQLEGKREQLCASLRQAWHDENYKQVVSLVADLAYIVGRFTNVEEGEHVLLLGIQACRYLHDQQHLAHFLSRLACLLCTRNLFDQALRVWQESEEVSRGLGYPISLWEPLCQVAHIADLLGTYGLYQRFAEQIVNAKHNDNPWNIPLALFIRGFHARTLGAKEEAYNDFTSCLRLLTEQHLCYEASPYTHFFALEVQTELARTQSQYVHAKGYGDAAIALARTFCDPYTVTALLIDQACFAFEQGIFHDAYEFLQQLLEMTEPSSSSYHGRSGHYMLGLLADRSKEFRVVLSTREQHVLQLVAKGLSNQEIATMLVITVGTVKKHIEHIYLKLDAHSRTHAVAKARALNMLT